MYLSVKNPVAKKVVLILFFMSFGWLGFGQTNPQPQQLPFFQDFTALAYSTTSYPSGFQGWRLGTSAPGTSFRTSSPTANVSLKANATANDNKSSSVYNYNGKIGFLHDNNGEAAIALAINTIGQTSVDVRYKVMTIRNPYNGSTNSRIIENILQYRIGTSGSFTNLTTVTYRNNTVKQTSGVTPQNIQSKSVILPANCNNQPIVQLRWVSRDVSGSGDRPSIAIDDVNISATIPAPEITVGGNIAALSTVYGTSSNAVSLTVSAINLTSNLNISAPNGFEISTSQSTGYFSTLSLTPLNGTIPSSVFYIRLKNNVTVGTYGGNIVFTSGTYNVTQSIAQSTISPKDLSITGISISDKFFDGSTNATIVGNAVLNGIVGSDDVSLSGTPSAIFSDAAVGNNKSVIVTGYVLSGTKASNYSVLQPTGLTASILLVHLTPLQMVQKMGTGINLGNILSAPYEGNWAAALTEVYVDNVARMRFKHVRIPIRFDNQTTPLSSVVYTDSNGNYIGSPDDYTVNATYLDRIDQIINWCLNRDLVVIIDVHGDHWFWESFDATSSNYKTGNDRLAAIDRFKAIWKAIALKFQNKPDEVLFEIMNEPFFNMNATEVIDINTQMLSIIRQNNPTRNVIVTGGGANSYEAPMQLSSEFLNSDDYLIATYHYYRPFAFTSSASQQYTDNDWGTTTDMNTVNTHFDQLLLWSQNNSVPIYMGEFGADNVNGYNYFTNTNGQYGGPDVNSRYAYHQYVAQAARQRGFALAVWDSGEKSGKTLYLNTPQSWVKDIRNAVLNATCENQLFIENANIECNYDYNWNSSFENGYLGKLNNSNAADGYQNSVSLHLNVNTTSGNFEGAVISNSVITNNILSGTNYTVSCMAKGDNNQQFRFRIKAIVNGITTYLTSSDYSLNGSYSSYSYSFIVPENTTQLTVQLLCGKNLGNYYFDQFIVLDSFTQKLEDKISGVTVYPNPASTLLNVKSDAKIVIEGVYNTVGQKVSDCNVKDNVIDVSTLSNGVYFLIITDEQANRILKKFIVKN